MSEISRIYYNKLVRDNIPAKIEAKKQKCEIRKISDVQELQQELMKKIKEEAASLAMCRTKEGFLEEYSDLMVVLETIISQLEISKEELLQARKDNLLKRERINTATIYTGQPMFITNLKKVRKEFRCSTY